LNEYHTEYNVGDNPKTLLRALEKGEENGSIKRISSRGMSGTFRLGINYCPSPKDLWREGVNFTNILRAAFAPIFLRQKMQTQNVMTKNLRVKLVQVSRA
jgi:hypothetical protein